MKLRLRKKIWNHWWFHLRVLGHNFWSFNTSDYRHLLNGEIRWDDVSNQSVHWRLK